MSTETEPLDDEFLNGRLLTGGDVARFLNISQAFAYQLMRQGEIPTVRIGRSVRVRRQDLETFISDSLVGISDPGLSIDLKG